MAKLLISDDWFTAPAQAPNGQLVMVTGRRGLTQVQATGKFNLRVTVTWTYAPDATGMPQLHESQLMEQVQDALEACFVADPVAVNTGIYTGDGQRDWVFYTRSLPIFRKKLNQALAPFPVLPLTFEADDDPQWDEYREMMQADIN